MQMHIIYNFDLSLIYVLNFSTTKIMTKKLKLPLLVRHSELFVYIVNFRSLWIVSSNFTIVESSIVFCYIMLSAVL